MKPIDTNGVERAVSALLGNAAQAVTTKLAGKFFARSKPVKRRPARQPARATRVQRPVRAGLKGGGHHG